MSDDILSKAALTNPDGPAPKRERRSGFQPQQKLAVPPDAIPGYKTYWFKGVPGRIAYARSIGFDFVSPDEVRDFLFAFDLGGDPMSDGNTDMGSRVSVPAQEDAGPDGQYLRLYLMKLPREHWDEDMQKYTEKWIDPVVQAFKAGTIEAGANGERPGDVAQRYRKPQPLPEMFKRKV